MILIGLKSFKYFILFNIIQFYSILRKFEKMEKLKICKNWRIWKYEIDDIIFIKIILLLLINNLLKGFGSLYCLFLLMLI